VELYGISWNCMEFHGKFGNIPYNPQTQEGLIGEKPRVEKSCDTAPFRKEGQFCVSYLCIVYFFLGRGLILGLGCASK
jgi:hypothetical protein